VVLPMLISWYYKDRQNHSAPDSSLHDMATICQKINHYFWLLNLDLHVIFWRGSLPDLGYSEVNQLVNIFQRRAGTIL
jgi:hypothetical protein